MRAQLYSRYGGPEVLELRRDQPTPVPGPGEVLVEVLASSINPVDWKVRRGNLKRVLRPSFPVTPGRDLCGRVVDCGPRATMFVPGDAVFGMCALDGSGSHADRVCVPEQQLAAAPKRLHYRESAALPLVGLTAIQAVEAAKLGPGARVLVQAGAGGVGSLAVQYARHLGAEVWATASARNLDYVRSLGAHAIDYRAERFEDRVGLLDVVIDCVGGLIERRSFSVLRRGGVLVSVTGPDPDAKVDARTVLGTVLPAALRVAGHRTRGVRYRFVSARVDHRRLVELAHLADEAVLEVRVDRCLPLEQLAEAHTLSEAGQTQGKLVLDHSL